MSRDPGRRNVIVEFFRGVGYAFSGVGLVISRPALWPNVLLPILVTGFLFALGIAGFVYFISDWVPQTDASVPQDTPLAFLWTFFHNLLTYGIYVGLAVLYGVVVYFISTIIATPFNDGISSRVEELRLGPYREESSWGTFFGDLVQSYSHSVLNLLVWLVSVGLAFVLNLIPGFGTIAAAVLTAMFTALFIARESMDGAQSRRRLSFAHKMRIARHHWAMMLGFGTVGALLVWIPVVNLVVVPLGIAGGTLMYCELEAAGRIPRADGVFGYTPPVPRDGRKADRRWRTKKV